MPLQQQHPPSPRKKKILLLHGSRQTGDLLLGRMDKLRKRLEKRHNIELVPLTAPLIHPEDAKMRQWWDREGDFYKGLLEETIPLVQEQWSDDSSFVGIMGFSQGARLAHLCCLAYAHQPTTFLPGLQFAILVAGYEAPLPMDFAQVYYDASTTTNNSRPCSVPTLHVYGLADKLISPEQSRYLLPYYRNPRVHEHEGGHHVPMRAASVQEYESFIESVVVDKVTSEKMNDEKDADDTINRSSSEPEPDEETRQLQQDEVEALTAIFPDEFHMTSRRTISNADDDDVEMDVYEFPICYQIDLNPVEDDDEGLWPPHRISIQVQYPFNYPQEALPRFKLIHENNVMQFSTAKAEALVNVMIEAGREEEGMPCVMSCIYAARDFFESGAVGEVPSMTPTTVHDKTKPTADEGDDQEVNPNVNDVDKSNFTGLIQSSTREAIHECNLQGLSIAETILHQMGSLSANGGVAGDMAHGKGGHWTYTIGLVGKPSAGKSTFFNTATAFARQRDDSDNVLGGATMAPHPFTTIDPNVGYCLVPAPVGSCPEDDDDVSLGSASQIGCTHGRNHQGRRLLPVLLKDVAGLVPGAYQGRGRGNKFLNDLTDAHVLIHVLDSSGTTDTEGNDVGTETVAGASDPLKDLAWIRAELIEWVFSNIMFKWESIRRRGRNKLADMFGYGQNQAVTSNVVFAVEKYMEDHLGRERAFDHLETWDEADVHRLVSAFLGVRFPMVLALNKCDLPTSADHIQNIQRTLPIHGAYFGTPLSARTEMTFMRCQIESALGLKIEGDNGTVPEGVWSCLQSALTLQKPVLVFPVSDTSTYAPLDGMFKHATMDPSLPSMGMIQCLESAGGKAPSLWNSASSSYMTTPPYSQDSIILRDVLIMKRGSTVDDVYNTLKKLGALGGDFVRAEATGQIGKPSRPIPKTQKMNRNNCILKIMTSKKTSWRVT